MNKQYFSLVTNAEKRQATINIYGDITPFSWLESDVSASNLSKQLEALTDVDEISVFINSYGGEVAEGLAIYNALKRHKAKVITCVDGFACSIASVIFMAGDTRRMSPASLLMIHNAWMFTEGNAAALRKAAEDLDKITSASVAAYMANVNISEVKLKHLMDKESWLTPSECVEMGFATETIEDEAKNPSQNAKMSLYKLIMAAKGKDTEDEPEEPDEPENDPDDTTSDDNGDDSDDEPEDKGKDKDKKCGSEEEEPEEEKETAEQKLSGFFNAILKNM